MFEDDERRLASLFAERASPVGEQEFVQRVNAKMIRTRRASAAIRVALLLAVLIVAAPFVPEIIGSVLEALGIPAP